MTAVAVAISPKRRLPDDLPHATRPIEAAAPPITAITRVADLDTVMDSVKCSCNAGDDNPHQSKLINTAQALAFSALGPEPCVAHG
ncbi:hypothetical protein [Streptomyces sp. HUAS TT7]|uniref:hypothetical protein n=1 Tax=Streptomyces sp. HUAS TT7 TaxID=3447507 RepID=UPI003F6568A6